MDPRHVIEYGISGDTVGSGTRRYETCLSPRPSGTGVMLQPDPTSTTFVGCEWMGSLDVLVSRHPSLPGPPRVDAPWHEISNVSFDLDFSTVRGSERFYESCCTHHSSVQTVDPIHDHPARLFHPPFFFFQASVWVPGFGPIASLLPPHLHPCRSDRSDPIRIHRGRRSVVSSLFLGLACGACLPLSLPPWTVLVGAGIR